MSKRTASTGHGSLATGAVTALALAVQTGLAAVVGVVIAQKLGCTAETDGFFAAYGVFIVLALAATAVRVTVLPPLARARDAAPPLGRDRRVRGRGRRRRAAARTRRRSLAAEPLAAVLTGLRPPGGARRRRRDAPLADRRGARPVRRGPARERARRDRRLRHPGDRLHRRRRRRARADPRADRRERGRRRRLGDGAQRGDRDARLDARARPPGADGADAAPGDPAAAGRHAPARLRELLAGAALPFALQAIYLICLPIAARGGVGDQTSFGYAYLMGAAVVAVTASSLGLVTSVPLTRAGLDGRRVATHVDASSWLALLAIGATAGIFAVAGGSILSAVLGDAYGDRRRRARSGCSSSRWRRGWSRRSASR